VASRLEGERVPQMNLPIGSMDFVLSPAQARVLYYLDYVTLDEMDDDLENPDIPEWPPWLNRTLAAQFLGVTPRWISMLSGKGPKGGQLTNHLIRGRVHWRLQELQAYKEARERRAA